MDQRTNRIAGFAVAALLAAPLLARGGMAVVTRDLETTARLGPVTHLSGPPAIWMGSGLVLLSVMILSVAAAQWPGLRGAGRLSAVVSLGAGLSCLAAALVTR